MITREQIEKIIEERYSDYPKFLSSTIEKIETRFKAQATIHRARNIEYIVTNPGAGYRSSAHRPCELFYSTGVLRRYCNKRKW